MPPLLARPVAGDFDSYHAGYVEQVPPGDLLQLLQGQTAAHRAACVRFAASPGHRYAAGKWTAREVLLHVNDTERVFGYRLLRFVRRDPTPLPGFDQDLFMAGAARDARTLDALADEFGHLRAANVSLLAACDAETLAWHGRMWEREISVLALACLCFGHAAHHLRVLDERYATGTA